MKRRKILLPIETLEWLNSLSLEQLKSLLQYTNKRIFKMETK